jgi:hypothetical protein
LATVAIPSINSSKNVSLEHFYATAGRAGSHYAPADLSSTGVKIPKLEIPDSLCSTGWACRYGTSTGRVGSKGQHGHKTDILHILNS